MALGIPWGTAYFTGTTTTTEAWWPMALGGHGYAVDRSQDWVRQTVAMIRQQSDTSDRPGEATLNPAGLWTRSQESWHHGAGQSWLDRDGTDPFRFHASKGVDPWEPYGLTLLPGTAQALPSGSSNLACTVFDGNLYVIDESTLKRSDNLTSWSSVAGNPVATASSVATDGSAVYVAYGASGLYRTTDGVTMSSYVVGTVDLVRYVKGRLIAAAGGNVYNIISGTLPAALLDHANSAWTWTDACEGQGQIYLSGYARDKSLIYRTAVTADGTALGAPTVAGELPDGETALSLTGYLGFVVIGTNLGVRFAGVSDGDGNLTIGALIETPGSVLCGEGQDRFVWFGYTNYDAASTGLGRLDLKTFTSPLTPAYASDLMVNGQGSVTSVVTVDGLRVFTVAGRGVYYQNGTVPSGSLTSGRVGFGISDSKTALSMDVRHEPLPVAARVTVDLSVDGEAPTNLGVSDVDGSTTTIPGVLAIPQLSGSFFEWTVTLTGGVELRKVALRADPNAERTELTIVPILLEETVMMDGRDEHPVAVYEEWRYLRDLCRTRRPVNYQEGLFVDRVVVEDFTWTPNEQTRDQLFNTGTFTVRLKSV